MKRRWPRFNRSLETSHPERVASSPWRPVHLLKPTQAPFPLGLEKSHETMYKLPRESGT